MNRSVMFAVAAGLSLLGRAQPQVDRGDAPGRDFVAVRIDGRDIRRSDVVGGARAVLQLTMNRMRKTKVGHREIRAVERLCRRAVDQEIAKAAVAKYLADRGLAVPSNVLQRVTRSFERQYGARSRKLRRMHNVGDLKYMLGKNASRADEMILEMARYEVMTNDVLSATPVVVTDEMARGRIRQIEEANRRAAATNALVFATATNVWRKITSGELTFEAAATKYSQDEYIADGCEWGCFSREQLEDDPAVLALLPKLKTGDITPPVESDGGLAILRKDEDDNPKTFSFSRVFFRLPCFFDEETPDEARRTLLEQKATELVQGTIRSYISKLRVEYPDGTNQVWKLTSRDFR